jgi:plastocyanin
MLVSMVLSLLMGTAPMSRQVEPTSVSIARNAFSPATAEIARNGKVRWTNNAQRDHTVTFLTLKGANDKPLTSGNLKPGDRWSHTFATAGEFAYRCDYIPRMQGKIVVK